MRGHRHALRLIGARMASGPDLGKVDRDSEGRWETTPTNPPLPVPIVEVTGFIGYPRRTEIPEGERIDTAAQLPRGTVVARGDQLEAYGIPAPEAELNGRYEIVEVQPGPVMVRVLLRRFTA